MLEAGKKIGEYVLIEKIGHGGFGDVWLAEKRTALSISQFALKFFRPAADDAIEIQTVQREVEVWQRISGLPNVIAVIEADFYENYIYIVSEYADGGSLQKWLAANGGKAWKVEQAVQIILEILNGLDYLHRAGFVHRDIKPANILIRKGTFCLADFGVTKEIKTHSVTQHTAGTYNYMPPEAFNKTPTVSPATDIWALAVIFQELLTGKLPFAQTEIPSLMYSIVHDEPDEMPADIPPALKVIVKKALHKRREDRYASAQEMTHALKGYQSGTIEKAAPPVEEKVKVSEEPKSAIAGDTIIDNSFAETNRVAALEQPSVAPIEKTHFQTVTVAASSGRKIKRNNLFVAAIAALLIFAVGVFFIAASFFSTNVSEYLELAGKCAAAEDYECAINNYRKAIELEPDSIEAYKRRAAVYYANGDFALAIPDYDRVIKLAPEDAAGFYGRGAALSNSGDFDRAVEDYTRAIELNPQNANYVFSRGLAFFNRKEYDKAIADYNRAIKLDASYAEAYNNRGNALDEQGNNDAAIKDYTKAIELDENFALAFSNRGTSYARKGNYNRAVEDLTRALELNPDFLIAYLNRANVNYLKKDYERALSDYNRYIEQNSNNALAFSNRGVILGEKKNYAQAIEDFTRAIELNPQDEQSYFNRAVIYEKLGNEEKARNDRQRYNDLRLKR